MNRTAKRISFLQGCFALALAIVVLRAGQLQLVEGSYWSEQAESRRTARDTLEARRGSIYDARRPARGDAGVLPRGHRAQRGGEQPANGQAASRALDVGAGSCSAAAAGKYMYFYGPYTATEIEPLRQLKGVHLEGSFRRRSGSMSVAGCGP